MKKDRLATENYPLTLYRVDVMPNLALGALRHLRLNGGNKEQLIDCDVEELTAGALKFHLIDYGDELDLSVETRTTLCTGNSTENNHCALLAFSAGIEWCLQGRPNRVPSKSRVRMLAKVLRAIDLSEARRFAGERVKNHLESWRVLLTTFYPMPMAGIFGVSHGSYSLPLEVLPTDLYRS